MSSNTKWVPVEPGDLEAGDKVRLTHEDGDVIHATVRETGGALFIGPTVYGHDRGGSWAESWWRRNGYRFERAVPERVLPSEPGLYADHYPSPGYTLYSLHDAGHWAHDGGGSKWQRIENESDVPADLVRLVPVTEVEEAEKRGRNAGIRDVLNFASEWDNPAKHFAEIARKYYPDAFEGDEQ